MNKSLLCALLALPLLARADGLPDLGDASQQLISPQMEHQIGEQSMLQIRSSNSYMDDPELSDYLNQLGGRLVANSPEPGDSFVFFAINDNAINAFALPGGFVGVNAGLIELAQTESELASVLSHEIAHVTQHHYARMVAGTQYDSLAALATLAVAILAARNSPQSASAAIVGAQAGAVQHQLNFTRQNEQEADRIGLGILEKSGFDTRAMPEFFERMQKATQLMEGNTPSYLRTHPVTAERIAEVENRVEHIPYHLVPDSLEFQLMRARLTAYQMIPQEAITFFDAALGAKKFGNPVAHRYGLVLALLRNNQPQRAKQEFALLHKQAPLNATIETLGGKIMQLDKPDKEVIAYYRTALQNFPDHHALIYDYAEVLLQDRHYKEALKLLDDQVNRDGNDPKLYDLEARAYAALGRHQEEHHMLAYNYILHGDLRGAIEQLELAKQAGNDYYQLSTIETELKQYREIAAAYYSKKRQ
ncbi:M48 family metalloprotease [Sideroxydans lithotrophicus]|uniref:Peptidase M48 Ste24p n=1 Tax=Sideroxydans lithotrophicus (strain ES-1) TaxID=580332 RepID=D5CMH1_SIDLE|nr:M48 family metalloprotease [Sideroxydans lithotrophicus]ADE12643.1 peptidase M48 Ste24p [Sideroxydans lithotrophicus ES-1]